MANMTMLEAITRAHNVDAAALHQNSHSAQQRLKVPRRAMAKNMATSRDNVMGCTLFDDGDLHGWQPEQDITSRIFRGRYATPVVVPPAVAILGCGRLGHDVIAIQTDRIEAHLRMPLSLTFDHRCIRVGEAARFLAAVIRDLQKGN
jgi:pyruvate/2-oxoglutarate dehydrogenase complex dihydrolipoamide acyltransferase (E2) component